MGGEFAEMEVERILDYEFGVDFCGYDYEPSSYQHQDPICRHCGAACSWGRDYLAKKWRLWDANAHGWHICQRFTSADTSEVKIGLDIDAALAARKNNGR